MLYGKYGMKSLQYLNRRITMKFNRFKELPNDYRGSERKKKILIDNEIYLLKFPDPTRAKRNELSYINNAISEYIGCNIFKSIGIPTQETILGEYKVGKEIKIACACKDFTDNNNYLQEFGSYLLSHVESDVVTPKTTDLEIILKHINRHPNLEIKNSFWDMFVVDALIDNSDRHINNWGFLYNKITDETTVAPIYDCGSSLESLKSDDELFEYISDSTKFKNLIYNSYSVMRLNKKRINYRDFILSLENEECNKAIQRIVPRININEIQKNIDETPYISDIRKRFYKDILQERKKEILEIAYNRLLEKKPSQLGKLKDLKAKADRDVADTPSKKI